MLVLLTPPAACVRPPEAQNQSPIFPRLLGPWTCHSRGRIACTRLPGSLAGPCDLLAWTTILYCVSRYLFVTQVLCEEPPPPLVGLLASYSCFLPVSPAESWSLHLPRGPMPAWGGLWASVTPCSESYINGSLGVGWCQQLWPRPQGSPGIAGACSRVAWNVSAISGPGRFSVGVVPSALCCCVG